MRLMVRCAKAIIVTVIFALGTASVGGSETQHEARPEVEQHILELINKLPANSSLRQQLVTGARGDGTRYDWMDNMLQAGIKQAVVWISINFDQRGKPKEMRVERVDYFAQYDNEQRISDTARLGLIRASGLEQKLTDRSLERAAHGAWIDVPHPKPRPFIGAAKVEFLDDEWLPILKSPLYCAGKNCLESQSADN